jgi:ADP-ribosyl-[dinitrogen reductase] hydrolase
MPRAGGHGAPVDFQSQKGWVLVALGNAFWQLLHAEDLEAAVSDTAMRGGDTDTNAAIAGALLGAVHGAKAIPRQWREAILSCRAEKGRPGVHHPRPRPFWPIDTLVLAERLAQIAVPRESRPA